MFVTGPCAIFVVEGCDLYTLPLDAGEGRRLTGDGRSAQPAISADGSTIAFTRLSPGPGYWLTDVFAMDVDGGNSRRLTEEDLASDPSWSPDGTHIVYVIGDGYWTGQIHIRGLDEEASLSVPTPGLDWAPVWSPDGTRIAFSRWTDSESGIYTMAPDGSDVVEVAAGGMRPVWSPASDRIAYQINGSPFVIDVTAETRVRAGAPRFRWPAATEPRRPSSRRTRPRSPVARAVPTTRRRAAGGDFAGASPLLAPAVGEAEPTSRSDSSTSSEPAPPFLDVEPLRRYRS